MPRKKINKEGSHFKFIPAGKLELFIKMAEANEDFKDKVVCLNKYVELFSNTVERCWNSNKKFVAISQRVQAGYLSCNKKEIGRLLNDMVSFGLFEINTKCYVLGKNSYEYRPLYSLLDMLQVSRNDINQGSDEMFTSFKEQNLEPVELEYFNVLKKITVDTSVHKYIESTQTEENCVNSSLLPHVILQGTFVPEFYIRGTFVPYTILGTITTELIPIYKLIAGKFRLSRKDKDSRLYTNITNLPREYRKFLRLNGKPLIGVDISNSQPMIATLAFMDRSMKLYSEIMPDVIAYKEACESGLFYEDFMRMNDIPLEGRQDFKKKFFGEVFYTKETENIKPMKQQFIDKYPTCYKGMLEMKGGEMYSIKYKEFPVWMQKLETSIIFTVNMKLIEMGYDVVNIFDSLYSDSQEAIDLGTEMIREAFNSFGINPNFKTEDYNNCMPANEQQERALVAAEPTAKPVKKYKPNAFGEIYTDEQKAKDNENMDDFMKRFGKN